MSRSAAKSWSIRSRASQRHTGSGHQPIPGFVAVLHILHSFWRVTETTKSVHTFLKTPGAFGMARAIADITPEKLEE